MLQFGIDFETFMDISIDISVETSLAVAGSK